MHPVTVRRLLVLGVCGVGVFSLYLVPSIARSPSQVTAPRPRDERTARPSASAVRDASAPTGNRTRPTSDATRPTTTTVAAEPPATEATTSEAPEPAPARTPREPRTTRTGATAFDPAAPRDDKAPEPVATITSADASPTTLSLRWPPASDDVGVVEYKVVLNGFEVATTPKTSATVRWFNDDTRQQVVQVRAVDAAGNESPSSPNLLVARPTPVPTPSPSEPTASPAEPSASPEPTPQPTPRPSEPSAVPGSGQSAAAEPDADPQAAPTDDEEN